MPITTLTYQVMIASPTDVCDEKNIIRQILYEWNTINTSSKKIVLLPISWETHSTPTMGGHPQKLLNKIILEDADLLIGVFWTRIGTSTEDYISGTVEEIEEHIKSGKPTMLYFSSAPVHPDSVDHEQYKKLKEFKSSCQSRGLYETYDSINNFKDKFSRQLQIKLNNDEYFNIDSDIEFYSENNQSKIQLSDEASALLIASSNSPNGRIYCLKSTAGLKISTNQIQFVNEPGPRCEATWEHALTQLINHNLIKDLGHKKEVLQITKQGYDLADDLKKQ